jgi:hypothetical protein
VRYSILVVLLLSMLCTVAGCYGPDYGVGYGYPAVGYAPYAYPYFGHPYPPAFVVHHPWEEHHGFGHHTYFGPGPGGHLGGHPEGGFAGHPGGFGGHSGGHR